MSIQSILFFQYFIQINKKIILFFYFSVQSNNIIKNYFLFFLSFLFFLNFFLLSSTGKMNCVHIIISRKERRKGQQEHHGGREAAKWTDPLTGESRWGLVQRRRTVSVTELLRNSITIINVGTLAYRLWRMARSMSFGDFSGASFDF